MGIALSWTERASSRSSSGGDINEDNDQLLNIDILTLEESSYVGRLSTKPIQSIRTSSSSSPRQRYSPNFAADHFIREPAEIVCECIHSETPSSLIDSDYDARSRRIGDKDVVMYSRNLLSDSAAQGIGAEDPNVFETGLLDGNVLSRTENVAEKLKELWNNGTELSIGGIKDFDKTWVIKSLNFRRNTDNAGAIEFTVIFQEIRKADLVIGYALPRNERGRGRRSRGRTSPSVQSATENIQSILSGTQPSR